MYGHAVNEDIQWTKYSPLLEPCILGGYKMSKLDIVEKGYRCLRCRGKSYDTGKMTISDVVLHLARWYVTVIGI